MRTRYPTLTLAGWATWLVTLIGCGERAAPPANSAPATATTPANAVAAAPPLRETHERYSWQGSPIGTIHTAYYADTLDGRPVVRIVSTGTLRFLRYGQQVEQQIRDLTWETPDGEVVRFESFLLSGTTPQMVTGTVEGTTATLTLRTAGKTESQQVTWPRGTGGSTAVVDALRRRPPLPGETRKLTAFMPILNRVAAVEVRVGAPADVDLDGTKRSLLQVDVQTVIAGNPPLESILWCDASGEVWKTEFPALGQTAVRTTADKAISPATPSVDLGTGTLVAVAPPLVEAHRTQFVRYRVKLKDGDAADKFPNTAGQVVRKLADGAAEIDVTAVRPTTPLPPGYAPSPPTDADRLPNGLVQSDDAEVKKLAGSAGGDDADLWDTAVRCERLVHDRMQSVEFSTAFATAAETARTLRGDCTEHAVLLTALLRARGLAARTVMGLVYVEGAKAFGYHMWTEAWLGDRWVPLDATLGRGGTSAAYLKAADSPLSGVDSYAAFLPVFPLLGRLQIEVVEQR